ncbi:TetR/AcrR family transcriptional regulator [Nafulsella turpanensis]|uniref:TetR/AcrR family transcriptional regulator n=1 Tax=Nafulsella turpanensis TaxID=1265690 RepID=UPI000347FDCF|nr:TetR/AcrR family transcriptional regulator [Nafulsella turpanensis]
MKGDDKRGAILKATMELITEHGFHATPMSMIAKQAGVAAGTIYNYFPSKEVLINQLYGELRQKIDLDLQQGEEAGGNLRDRFFSFYRRLFHCFMENPEEFMFLEQYTNSPFISQSGEGEMRQFPRVVVDFLKNGTEVGILRQMDIALMAAIVHGQVVATTKLHLSGTLDITEERLEKAAQSCWDSVKIT